MYEDLLKLLDSNILEYSDYGVCDFLKILHNRSENNPWKAKQYTQYALKLIDYSIKQIHSLEAAELVSILDTITLFELHIIQSEGIKVRLVPLIIDRVSSNGTAQDKTELIYALAKWGIHKRSAKPVINDEYIQEITSSCSPEELSNVLEALKAMSCNAKDFREQTIYTAVKDKVNCNINNSLKIARLLVAMRFPRTAIKVLQQASDSDDFYSTRPRDEMLFILDTCNKAKRWPDCIRPILDALSKHELTKTQISLLEKAQKNLLQAKIKKTPTTIVMEKRPRWADIFDEDEDEGELPDYSKSTSSQDDYLISHLDVNKYQDKPLNSINVFDTEVGTDISSHKGSFSSHQLTVVQSKSWADIYDSDTETST